MNPNRRQQSRAPWAGGVRPSVHAGAAFGLMAGTAGAGLVGRRHAVPALRGSIALRLGAL